MIRQALALLKSPGGWRWEWPLLAALAALPILGGTGRVGVIGAQLTDLLIFAILALGLHVVVGQAGLLHLGIAAFFGIGAYIAGLLLAPSFPFQTHFIVALVCAGCGAGLCGLALGAPLLRLRGDYLALVTLGFGEMARVAIQNLRLTKGTTTISSIPPPHLPETLRTALRAIGVEPDWNLDYRLFYALTLLILAGVLFLLRRLEESPLGRAWVAIREDELAASCMGVNVARVKLSAFALGAALAGVAGCLYAVKLTNTSGPGAYDFSRSVITLCCIILGGLGSRSGALLGVLLIVGFDSVVTPLLDGLIQSFNINPAGNRFLSLSSWRLMLFGLALVLMMRFRPEGLLPSRRVKHELHPEETARADDPA